VNHFLLPVWALLLLAVICVLYIWKLRDSKLKIMSLQAGYNTHLEFYEYTSACLLALNEGQYRQKHLASGKVYDDLGSTIAAARLSFEYLMMREFSGSFKENEVFNKAYGCIEDAYDKVKDLESVTVYESCYLLAFLTGMATKATSLFGVNVNIKLFGVTDTVNAHYGYLLFFLIRKFLIGLINKGKKGEIDINILQKQNQFSLVIQTKGILLEEATLRELREISKDITVFTEALEVNSLFNDKVVIVIPYI
jgi:hypothetical protein